MNKFKFKKGVFGVLRCEVENPLTKNKNDFCTNNAGNGIFLNVFDVDTGEQLICWKQIQGTAQFTVNGIKENSQKAKMRKYIKNYFKEFWDCEI